MTDASSPRLAAMRTEAARMVMLGGLVFAAALLGIWARPIGFLSAIWPANALLLGVLLQKPTWVRPASMLGALAGYVCADLVTGSSPGVTLLLSAANMAEVGVAWLLMYRWGSKALLIQRQSSALLLFLGCGMASLVSAALGSPVITAIFQTPALQAFSMWFTAEWLNYMILLPPLMAWPTRKLQHSGSENLFPLLRAVPLLMVVGLEITSYWLGGPGALVFSLPALLWCALSYRVFTLTLIISALCLSKMMAIALGSFDFTPTHFLETVSFRIGLCMLVLGPLVVASSHATRTRLVDQLNRAVNYDFLTATLARRAFLAQGQRLLDRCAHARQPVAVFMLDLDHFKQINDSFGHAGGDELLRSFSQTLSHVLRPQDLIGRMGGEEFAAVLPQVDGATALNIARRINLATRGLRVAAGGDIMTATVSIGLVHVRAQEARQSIDLLLQKADEALYTAKARGRDRCEEWTR